MTTSDEQKDSTVYVVFSDDWGVHPSSSQHIFRHINKRRSVIWINTIGMRRPRITITDLGKAIRKLGSMFRTSANQSDKPDDTDMSVFAPLMIPFNDISMVRRFNKKSVARTLKKAMRGYEGRDTVVVTTVPNSCDYVDSVQSRKIIYYCVDDFSEWPGLDKELVLEMEGKLIEKADLFLASSQHLVDRLATSGKPSSLLSHGVDVGLFSTIADAEHPILDDIPTPRVGYFGLFDERSDQGLIADVAEKLPQVSFVIAGRVETGTSRLNRLNNVYFVGNIAYHELPRFVSGMDVLFLPYIVNALSDALSPLKFKEYIATGRPVISTPIAAAEEFSSLITIASSSEHWNVALTAGIGEGNAVSSEVINARLRGESWVEKSDLMMSVCERR